MSHETGKVEIVSVDAHHIFARYHRAKSIEDRGRFMVFQRDDSAYWLDQLEPVAVPCASLGVGSRGLNGDGGGNGDGNGHRDGRSHLRGRVRLALNAAVRRFGTGCSQGVD